MRSLFRSIAPIYNSFGFALSFGPQRESVFRFREARHRRRSVSAVLFTDVRNTAKDRNLRSIR